MSQDSLEEFRAYRKACVLFDHVIADMRGLRKVRLIWKLIEQQIAAADSVAANIEEGHGRSTPRDYARFLDQARASAREVRGRYQRMKHWMCPEVVSSRVAICDEIIAILTSAIRTLRSR